ncbi:hypothetical protein BDZ90DRAFT_223924 [Jaminaea rosea]|uniref:Pescadillo homolog n=1 Tax=Jaminaea rosea TaxID=1569628 RepID=A0A316UIW8_9BASI|nr:hypothetical protein BDZ90DRAFT_223924 [Jaminaea rosea]PWN25216.1 hypothetical protein BDZ90DRAFT_223924 [Jaminaea rosea]
MARLKKRGESGAAKNFVTRNQALKKLQVSLSDFRRLCILKGIHPQQPRHVKRANKGSTAPASFYYAKDIQYLAHEPILRSLRDHKTFAKKLSRAVGRREWAAAKNLDDAKPQYTLDHIIKERYPTFDEAIGDIDDALCMIALFANLPAKMYNLPEGVVDTCSRLKREWDEYIVRTKALNKTFLSIKGIYFQATIRRKDVTWLVPYPFTQHVPHDVDFRIMSTFLELYTTLLSFVLFKLYADLGESYPPNLDQPKASSAVASTSASSSSALSKKAVRKAVRAVEHDVQPGDQETAEEDIEEAAESAADQADDFAVDGSKSGIDTLPLPSSDSSDETRTLFRNCTVYLDRSTPLSLLSFILRSYGSFNTRIGWDETLAPNSPLQEDDARITHVIIDRPELEASKRKEGRKYVQPQWVVDCANRGSLLPEDKYAVGATLPPHLSPFVEGEVVDEELAEGEASGSSDDEDDGGEQEEVPESRPALRALLESADDPDAAHDAGLMDAAELEAESMGGEAELDRVRAAWLKATGGAGGASTASASADPTSAPSKKKKQGDAATTAAAQEEEEARKMARGLLSNRQRKLYDKMSYTKAKKAEEAQRLAKRREEIKRDEKKQAKASKVAEK